MTQPQSDDEIRWILDELKALDPLLDIRWNPQAVMLAKGSYSELGKLVPPTYDGRWEIIRYQTASRLREDRNFAVICTITEPRKEEGIWVMVPLREGGKYAPIGEWVLEMMRQSDAQNVEQFRKIREKLWSQHDRAEAARDKIDEGAVIAALDHNHFEANYAGGVGNWQGKGVDFQAMEAKATQRAVGRILTTTTTR